MHNSSFIFGSSSSSELSNSTGSSNKSCWQGSDQEKLERIYDLGRDTLGEMNDFDTGIISFQYGDISSTATVGVDSDPIQIDFFDCNGVISYSNTANRSSASLAASKRYWN